jgi:hypothetical protein
MLPAHLKWGLLRETALPELMNEANSEKISEEEMFANAYYYFLEALKILACDADTQCKIMGNYNVAWELKDDVCRGFYLLDMPKGELSVEERNGISELISALSEIPDSVLASADSEVANRKAMNDPCWIPLRIKASNLIRVLHNARIASE